MHPLRPQLDSRIKQRKIWLVLLALGLALGLIGWLGMRRSAPDNTPIALFTTLPLLWSEDGDLGSVLQSDAPSHWAKTVLSQHGQIVPLSSLASNLTGIRRMMMAQPRPLSPAENVALDTWVRGGGQLLLLADPALTEDSPLALGDPRRPQTAVMLSPILARWGLELRFDEAQALGETAPDVLGLDVPVNLPGRFETRGQANCKLWGQGLAVTCVIGQGRVIALADAALLERGDSSGSRPRVLGALLDSAFIGR